MSSILHIVRSPLLNEAKMSPALLADLAGLEEYIAESYDSRSFIELLQNADDAGSSRFHIEKCGPHLLVANNGRLFSELDFESLCRSAASRKNRKSSIGYRGIGFKSVVSMAKKLHLISGELEATFCRKRTVAEIPEASRVPLIRIPHPIVQDEHIEFQPLVEQLKAEGFLTIFIFSDLLAHAIENEFDSFDPTSLLFLRNINLVTLKAEQQMVISIMRKPIDSRVQSIELLAGTQTSSWLLVKEDLVSLAFSQKDGEVRNLDEHLAVVHAFLPTNEPTGMSVKFHGDISTDPSRTRVVFDERTDQGIQEMARLVLSIVHAAISDQSLPQARGMLAALLPISDPRLAGLQKKAFKSELFSAVRELGCRTYSFLKCRPKWLNPVDFEEMARVRDFFYIPRKFEDLSGVDQFFRFLGGKEVSLAELMIAFPASKLTVTGCAEIVSEIIRNTSTKQIDISQINQDWPVWVTDGEQCSINQALFKGRAFDTDFRDLVAEKSMGECALRHLLNELVGKESSIKLLPEKPTPKISTPTSSLTEKILFSGYNTLPLASKPPSLKKWRGAEEQVRDILVGLGWETNDVSRQNIGYDIECITPEGEKLCIEVKLVGSSNKPFTLTSNEEAVARQKRAQYLIAVVCQSREFIEVAFIRDPVQQLQMTRQCRQWVWECDDYPYEPLRFAVED